MKRLNLFLSIVLLSFATIGFGQGDSRSFQQVPPSQVEEVKPVKLFPNPAIDYVHVKFEAPQAKTSTFTLHNIIGNTLETETEVVDEFEVRVRVKDLSAGMYLLSIKNDYTRLKGAYKFIKK